MRATEWKRVLWVRLDHIGDVVMSLPMLANLCRALPNAEIDCLVLPAVVPILRASGLPVRILSYDSPRFPAQRLRYSVGPLGRGSGFFRTSALVRRLRARHYDATFELRGDEVGRTLAALSGAPVRIGPDRQFYEVPGARNGRFLMTEVVPFPEEPRHAVLNNLALLRAAGIHGLEENFRFPVSEALTQRVQVKLAALEVEGKVIAIHPGSNDPLRNWDVEKWGQTLRWLRQHTAVPVILTGSPRDHGLVSAIRKSAGEAVGALDATGRFALDELPALFALTQLMVTVDTGPMHIAAMQGTPIVALMRSDLAPRHHPWGQPENVVSADEGKNVPEIDVENVIKTVKALL